MISIQLLKSSSFYSRCKMNSIAVEFSCRKRILRLSNPKVHDHGRLRRVCCQLRDNEEDQNNGEELSVSLFIKELRRRGITPTSLLEEGDKSICKDEDTKFEEEDRGFLQTNVVSTDSETKLFNQKEQSMALNSKGLEGLIPRAKLLFTVGGTFFLRFWPPVLVSIAFFSALYLYFGPTFIHDASESSVTPSQYIDHPPVEEERLSQIAPPLN